MLAAKIARMLRSKLLVLVLGSVILLYLFSLLDLGLDYRENRITDDPDTAVRRQKFRWDSPDDANDTNSNVTLPSVKRVTCRNSIQGKLLLADDRGYVCPRLDRLGTGCCNTAAENTFRYRCLTCNPHHCCAIYEYCVSCCMNPDKKSLLQRVLSQVSEGSPLYASVSDQFELCLVKCRTSSQSVQHETLYRDPRAKHCFGERLPALHGDT